MPRKELQCYTFKKKPVKSHINIFAKKQKLAKGALNFMTKRAVLETVLKYAPKKTLNLNNSRKIDLSAF
jgi:hypothetical protein